jgi:hypothetical protein
VYEYDITYKKKGQPQKATVLYNGKDDGTVEFTYNKDGTTKNMYLVTIDGAKQGFEYTYKNGRIVTRIYTPLDGITYKTNEYAYDSKGRLTKNYEWGEPDDFWGGYEYKYDSNGNVTKVMHINTDEEAARMEEYKYDKYGNLISAYEINEYDNESRYEYEYRLAYITHDIDENVEIYMNFINSPYVYGPVVFSIWGELV